MTLKNIIQKLQEEGHTYRPSQPKFSRTALSYILNNRFYIGEIRRREKLYPGKYRPLIDRRIFDTCKEILKGKNRASAKPIFHCLAVYLDVLFAVRQ